MAHGKRLPRLSRKEREVLLFGVKGLRDKEIAGEMKMSLVTVRYYWQKIVAKVQARTRVQAIYRLCCDGQLSSEGSLAERLSPLSHRERRLLCLAVGGHRDAEIARKLGISVATVRHYWDRIERKAGAETRLQALFLLFCDGQLGILGEEEMG